MVLVDRTGTTTCPNCGGPMPMISWVGEKLKCYRCSDASHTDELEETFEKEYDNNLFDGFEELELNSKEEEDCLHEGLSRRTADHLDGPHMISCPCPKCSPRV